MSENDEISKKSLYNISLRIFLTLIVMIFLSFFSFLLIEQLPSLFLSARLVGINITLIYLSISFLSIILLLSINEYKQKFIKKRVRSIGRSYLSMEDIFQNENRIKIIKEIIKNPGIHQNELMRSCDLQKGQLQWHLDVLIINQIIKKQSKGQYSLFFPNLKSFEPPLETKKGIIKNSSTHHVLKIIKNNPGINSSLIAKRTNLANNTIKYHIDKLVNLNLIYKKRVGRRKELYPQI